MKITCVPKLPVIDLFEIKVYVLLHVICNVYFMLYSLTAAIDDLGQLLLVSTYGRGFGSIINK